MKKKLFENDIVYSTNPKTVKEIIPDPTITLSNEQQLLRISLDTKSRQGKKVTLIENFVGTEVDLLKLTKQIKTHCGTGGTNKDGRIEIQGDFRAKIAEFLIKESYKIKRIGF